MRYRVIIILLTFLTASTLQANQYDQLAEELLLNIKDKDLKKVFAIVPFKAKGVKSGVDEEETATFLNALKKFNITISERADLPDVLKEIELSQKGVGKKKMDLEGFENASFLIVGVVHHFENESKKFFIKTIDVSNSLIVSTAEIYMGEAVDSAVLKSLSIYMDQSFYDAFFAKVHFSFFIGSGWQSSFAAPVNILDTVYLQGPPLFYWMRLGYPINQQLTLFVHLGNSNIFSPFISASNDIVRDRQLTDVNITLLDLGAGFAWYFLPSRFYLTASVGDSSAIYKNTNEEVDINFGLGVNLAVGYRHKITRTFGIGAMIGVYYSHLDFSNINVTIPTTQGFYVNDSVFKIDTFTVYAGAIAFIN